MARRSGVTLPALLVLGACASTASPPGAAPAASARRLEGTAWTLATLDGRPVVSDATASMSFGSGGSLTGSDGCNRFGGTYRADATALRLTPGRSTMMACPEPIMEQARAFVAALTATRSWAVREGGPLVLLDGAGTSLATFTAVELAALPGTRWTATAVNDGRQAVVSLVEATEITAVFGADGTLAGSAGCNQYHTRWERQGDRVTFGPVAMTRRACAPPVMAQEQHYADALARATRIHLEEDRLDLRDEGGALQVTFRRVR